MNAQLNSIGTIRTSKGECRLELKPEYAGALTALEGFSHIQVLWWFDRCDDAQSRATLTVQKPYAHGPALLGTFATRSPQRPNPIALSCAEVTQVDREAGTVRLGWIDAEDGSPLLDVKPYVPALDRVANPAVPAWCAHWPDSLEASADFDWQREFLFP